MNTRKRKITTILLSAIALKLLALATGCSEGENGAADNVQTTEGVPSKLANLILSEKPEGSIPVAEARKTASPGERIVVVGQIGTTMVPFGKNFATLVLGDESILFCDEMADDHCTTPWDACCEDPDKIASSRATVQVVRDGQVVRESLDGVGGMDRLDRIIVVGTVDASTTADNLLINATGIYPEPRKN